MTDRKLEIYSTSNGFVVRNNETGAIVQEYNRDELWERAKQHPNIKEILNRIISNTAKTAVDLVELTHKMEDMVIEDLEG